MKKSLIQTDESITVSTPGSLGDFLVGLTEIGRMSGVSNRAVCNWRTRYEDFPEPVVQLSFGPVYWKPEIERWLIKTGRLEVKHFERM